MKLLSKISRTLLNMIPLLSPLQVRGRIINIGLLTFLSKRHDWRGIPLIIIFSVIFLSPNIYAQKEIGLTDVLNESLENYYSQFNDHSYKDFSPAWFDDIEIRTETHDFELRKQEYNLRFTPVSAWLRAAQRDYYESKIMEFDNEIREIIAGNLKIIYENWVSLVIGQRRISIADSLIILNEDEETVRKRTLSFSTENIDKFIFFRERKNEMAIEHLSYLYKFAIMKNDLFSQISMDTNFMIKDEIIDLELIRKAMNGLKKQNIYKKSSAYKELQIEESIVSNELKIEEAENTKILDFLQFTYRGPHDDPMNERLLMTLALRLPLAGRNKMKTQLLRVEGLEVQNKIKAEEQEFIFDINELLTNLEILFSEYDVMKKYSDELKEESAFLEKNMGTLANSPLWVISNKKNILNAKLKLLDISKEIYLEYIDILDLIGAFAIEPGTNYLEVLPEL